MEGSQTPVWFLRTRGLHLIKQGVLIPFLQRCSQSRKASESCSKADRALLHLHGLTDYLGTTAASTGMFQIIENHPSINISCTCSMGLCKFLALAPHVMKGHVINSFQRSTDNEYSWMCITNQSCMVPKVRFRLMVSVSIRFFRQLFMENFELGHI